MLPTFKIFFFHLFSAFFLRNANELRQRKKIEYRTGWFAIMSALPKLKEKKMQLTLSTKLAKYLDGKSLPTVLHYFDWKKYKLKCMFHKY